MIQLHLSRTKLLKLCASIFQCQRKVAARTLEKLKTSIKQTKKDANFTYVKPETIQEFLVKRNAYLAYVLAQYAFTQKRQKFSRWLRQSALRHIFHWIMSPFVLIAYSLVELWSLFELMFRGKDICAHRPSKKDTLWLHVTILLLRDSRLRAGHVMNELRSVNPWKREELFKSQSRIA